MTRTVEERSEIERHKYLLSEKMGYDVGWQYAERDWDENHANDWRRYRDNNSHQDADAEVIVASPETRPTDSNSPPVAVGHAQSAHRGGWLKGLFRRFRA